MRVHVTGDGPPIVLVHGALVNANLWRGVVAGLDGFTRVTLDMPLGSHLEPLPNGDLSPLGLAGLIGDAVSALGLEGVTLVGNDTGGGLCQLAAAMPDARVEWLEQARSLSPEDEPARLAELIAAFVRERVQA